MGGSSNPCVRYVLLLRDLPHPPRRLGKMPLRVFFVSEDVPLPLIIRWNGDRDVIISRYGMLSIPFEEVKYDYTIRGSRVTGTIPAREKWEWYMSIGSDGITINK